MFLGYGDGFYGGEGEGYESIGDVVWWWFRISNVVGVQLKYLSVLKKGFLFYNFAC